MVSVSSKVFVPVVLVSLFVLLVYMADTEGDSSMSWALGPHSLSIRFTSSANSSRSRPRPKAKMEELALPASTLTSSSSSIVGTSSLASSSVSSHSSSSPSTSQPSPSPSTSHVLSSLRSSTLLIYSSNLTTTESSNSSSTQSLPSSSSSSTSSTSISDSPSPGDEMACPLPQLDPWDPSLKDYVKKEPPVNCSRDWPSRIDDIGMLILDEGLLKDGGTCRARTFHRTAATVRSVSFADWQDVKSFVADLPRRFDVLKDDKRKRLRPLDDFVHVECSKGGKVVHSHYHARGTPYPNDTLANATASDSDKPLNIVMLHLDSVSRSNAIRQLPLSLKFLEEADGTVLKGNVKIGDNTSPNFAAAMSGLRIKPQDGLKEDIPDAWKDFDAFEDVWIWQELEKRGYATILSYDYDLVGPGWWERGGSRGFKHPEFHHYLEPFWTPVFAKAHKPWYKASYGKPCYGAQSHFDVAADYALRLQKAYHEQGRPTFTILETDYFSHGHNNGIGKADGSIRAYLEGLKALDWENTVVFMYGDHGQRRDSLRRTFVGRQEASLPLASVMLPDRIHKAHPDIAKHLKANSELLTTQFDLHASLKDIIADFPASKNHSAPPQAETLQRDYSVFGPIPKDRNCRRSGIPVYYCVCLEERKVEPKDFNANHTKLGELVATSVMDILEPVKEFCANFTLQNVTSVSLVGPSEGMRGDTQDSEADVAKEKGRFHLVRIAVRLSPGNVLLQALVREEVGAEGTGTVMRESLNRLNTYGQTSACIRDKPNFAFLRTLCWCNKQP